jgi:hypothetical protein
MGSRDIVPKGDTIAIRPADGVIGIEKSVLVTGRSFTRFGTCTPKRGFAHGSARCVKDPSRAILGAD